MAACSASAIGTSGVGWGKCAQRRLRLGAMAQVHGRPPERRRHRRDARRGVAGEFPQQGARRRIRRSSCCRNAAQQASLEKLGAAAVPQGPDVSKLSPRQQYFRQGGATGWSPMTSRSRSHAFYPELEGRSIASCSRASPIRQRTGRLFIARDREGDARPCGEAEGMTASVRGRLRLPPALRLRA